MNAKHFQTWPANPAMIEADDLLVLESLGFEVSLRALYRNTLLAHP